jgi:hypothetical protein
MRRKNGKETVMPARKAFVALSFVALVCVASGCGPHAYLKDYFLKNGGFAYMNPPSNLEGPGTIIQFQGNGMLTVYSKDSAFPKVPVVPGDMQFADFDDHTEWQGSLSLAFDFMPETPNTGKLKASLVTAGARTVKFRFGPARKKVVELGKLVEAIQSGSVPPVAVEFLKSRYTGVIAGVAEVSEMTFDFSAVENFQIQVDAELLQNLGSLTGGSFKFTTAGEKAFKISFKDRPLYVGYYLWQPKFDEAGHIIAASAKVQPRLLYAPDIERLRQRTP